MPEFGDYVYEFETGITVLEDPKKYPWVRESFFEMLYDDLMLRRKNQLTGIPLSGAIPENTIKKMLNNFNYGKKILCIADISLKPMRKFYYRRVWWLNNIDMEVYKPGHFPSEAILPSSIMPGKLSLDYETFWHNQNKQ